MHEILYSQLHIMLIQIEVGFLMVGHTHEDIDQRFSCFSRYLHKHSAVTMEGTMCIMYSLVQWYCNACRQFSLQLLQSSVCARMCLCARMCVCVCMYVYFGSCIWTMACRESFDICKVCSIYFGKKPVHKCLSPSHKYIVYFIFKLQ